MLKRVKVDRKLVKNRQICLYFLGKTIRETHIKQEIKFKYEIADTFSSVAVWCEMVT
jgi:hypothetical protein